MVFIYLDISGDAGIERLVVSLFVTISNHLSQIVHLVSEQVLLIVAERKLVLDQEVEDSFDLFDVSIKQRYRLGDVPLLAESFAASEKEKVARDSSVAEFKFEGMIRNHGMIEYLLHLVREVVERILQFEVVLDELSVELHLDVVGDHIADIGSARFIGLALAVVSTFVGRINTDKHLHDSRNIGSEGLPGGVNSSEGPLMNQFAEGFIIEDTIFVHNV